MRSIFLRAVGFLICLLAPVPLTAWGSGGGSSSTTLIRELAKSKNSVYIVATGNDSMEMGRSIQTAIMRNQDNRHKPDEVQLLAVDQIQQAASNRSFADASLICLWIAKERSNPLPAELAASFQTSSIDATSRDSVIQCQMTRTGGKKGVSYGSLLFAPDKIRMEKILDVFMQRAASHFSDLPFSADYRTNKVALFSDSDVRSSLGDWGNISGKSVWNDVQWHSLSDRSQLTSDQLEERSEVYFIDRSSDKNELAPDALKIIDPRALKPTTVMIARGKTDDGREIAVISSPTDLILKAKIARYHDLDALSSATETSDLIDLSGTGPTALVIAGNNLQDAERDSIRTSIEKAMRSQLHLDVSELSPDSGVMESEVTLQRLLGDSDGARKMRDAVGFDHVWLLEITSLTGSTTYETAIAQITPNPLPFSEFEPQPPSEYTGPIFHQHKKDPVVYHREYRQYEEDHQLWEQKKQDFDNQMASMYFTFSRTATAHSTARAHGILHLADLRGSGKVVWEGESDSTADERKSYASDQQTVQGLGNQPPSIETPPNSSDCSSDLIIQAVLGSGEKTLMNLQENALLSSVVPPVKPPAPPVTPPIPPTKKPALAVASVKEKTVYLSAGTLQGIRVGDRVVIPLIQKQVNGQNKIIESVQLKVIRADDNASDCLPIGNADALKIWEVKPGMEILVRHDAKPTVPPTTKASKKPTSRKKA